jgi:dolichyldiphosphatase
MEALKLFLVEYPLSNHAVEHFVTLAFAYASMFPILWLFVLLGIILALRDLTTIMFLLGLVLNEGVNYALKKIIQEERPPLLFTERERHVGFGMPSSHSQYMGFFCTFIFSMVFLHWEFKRRVQRNSFIIILTVILAFLVVTSRVYLGYHTILQVSVGFTVGLMNGYIWSNVVYSKWVRGAIDSLPLVSLKQWFLIRDFSDIKDVDILLYEYTEKVTKDQRKKLK